MGEVWAALRFSLGCDEGSPTAGEPCGTGRGLCSVKLTRSCRIGLPYHIRMPELVFEVVQEADGGYCSECLTEGIFTEGETWDELRKKVLEATALFHFDRPRPARVRLHLVRDEVLPISPEIAQGISERAFGCAPLTRPV